jgi:hypothetical protein
LNKAVPGKLSGSSNQTAHNSFKARTQKKMEIVPPSKKSRKMKKKTANILTE